jgi:predicted Zn-dependent protease
VSRENKLRKLKSRRDRGLPRKSTSKEQPSDLHAEAASRGIRLVSMNISFDALESSPDEGKAIFDIPEEERARLHGMLYEDPAQAIEPLQKLLAEHPGDTTLTQWLTAAFRGASRDDEADRLAEENYHAHPRYLFARLDYAKALLRQNRMEEIERMPERDIFHVSELAALSMFMVEFYIKKRNLKQAEIYANVFERIAPNEPATAAMNKTLAFARLRENARQFFSLDRWGRS